MEEEEIDCIIFHLWLEDNGLLDEWFECISKLLM
jgi:hypothetical protein